MTPCVSLCVWEVVRIPRRVTFEPFWAKRRVSGRSKPKLPGRAPITEKAYGRNPAEGWRRLARKAGSDWVSETGGGNLGNVSGQIPGTPWGWWQEGRRQGEKGLKLYPKWNPAGLTSALHGVKGWKDLPRIWLGVRPGHITQEHRGVTALACASAIGSWNP